MHCKKASKKGTIKVVRCRNISYFLFLWWKVSGASKLYSLETGPLGQAGTIVISGARSGPLCGDLTVNTSCDDRGLAAGSARWSQAALEMWTMVACWQIFPFFFFQSLTWKRIAAINDTLCFGSPRERVYMCVQVLGSCVQLQADR